MPEYEISINCRL